MSSLPEKSHGSRFDLQATLDEIAHRLPSQGPIKDFVHHNTLHSFQHLPFDQAVIEAGRFYRACSHMPLEYYRNAQKEGGIGISQLSTTILKRVPRAVLDSRWFSGKLSGRQLIELGLRELPDLRDLESLEAYSPGATQILSQIEKMLPDSEVDIDSIERAELNSCVNPVMFRLLSSYLDQGVALWMFPHVEKSFLGAIRTLVMRSWFPIASFTNKKRLLKSLRGSAHTVCIRLLKKLAKDESRYQRYLEEMLMAHPGWSGISSVLENHPHTLHDRRKMRLMDVAAVRLALEYEASFHLSAKSSLSPTRTLNPDALVIAGMLGKAGVKENEITRSEEFSSLCAWLTPHKLAWIWHEALEETYYENILGALRTNVIDPPVKESKSSPSIQAIFCIDDRECSFRRYIEETDPTVETYSAAGFFGVDFMFQSVDSPYAVALCPINIRPKHVVRERPKSTAADHHASRSKRKKRSEKLRLSMHESTLSILFGWLSTSAAGPWAAMKLATSILWPEKLGQWIRKTRDPMPTEFELLHTKEENGMRYGYTHEEMADRVENILRATGLTRNFASLVAVFGHGSSSINNPHFAAYNCGACSGNPGAPNARAFAIMANMPEVRALLAGRKIEIPETTLFIGGYHDTCADEVTFFDEEKIVGAPLRLFVQFRKTLRTALMLNARERCRRFELAPKDLTPEEALKEVVRRSTALFEPRPELNHATNALCIVGKRGLTKNLFLDRRAFLQAYDHAQDPQGKTLAGILGAVIPVCAGINLEYLFSRLDNNVYGSGTKLPHNVSGLVGVMNGIEDDLRTGLPEQMIEVHDPIRILFVLEQSPGLITQVLERNPSLLEWVENSWVSLSAIDPKDASIWRFVPGTGFVSMNVPPLQLRTIDDSVGIAKMGLGNLNVFRIVKGASS